MCGRFAQAIPLGKLTKVNLFDGIEGIYSDNYNLAPSQMAFTLSAVNEKRLFKPMKWGLIPSWTKSDKTVTGLINAKFETLTEKPSFRHSYKVRRCIVPVTGFYEWRKTDKNKEPFFINWGIDHDGEFKPMFLCGLYDVWISPDNIEITSFAIITIESSGSIRDIHHRMPLIIDQEKINLWLGSDYRHDNNGEEVKSKNTDKLTIYHVSDYVNSVANNSPKCIQKTGTG